MNGSPSPEFPSWLRPDGHARQADLSSAELAGRDLQRLRGDALDFRRANLTGANLTAARLDACLFTEARLAGTRFNQAVLRGTDFSRAQAPAAVFDQARLEDSTFENADATRAQFKGARLSETSFARSTLREAIFDSASGAGASFRGADLTRAIFTTATLDDADFRGADLTGVSFAGARLSGADFRGAILDGIDWTGAEWPHALFDEGAEPQHAAASAATPGAEAAESTSAATSEFGPELERLAESFLQRLRASPRPPTGSVTSPSRVRGLPTPANTAQLRDLLGALDGTLGQREGGPSDVFQGLQAVLRQLEDSPNAEPPPEWRAGIGQILNRLQTEGRDPSPQEIISAILGAKPPTSPTPEHPPG